LVANGQGRHSWGLISKSIRQVSVFPFSLTITDLGALFAQFLSFRSNYSSCFCAAIMLLLFLRAYSVAFLFAHANLAVNYTNFSTLAKFFNSQE
jgi:uncharacterized membrane protein YdjX (TVP38/TMEM64 family)